MREDAVTVGIDVGQSNLKVAVFDRRGRLLAHGQTPYRIEHDADGRPYQDPEQWIDGAGELLRGFVAAGRLDPACVAAIGASGRGGAGLFVDREGRLLAPFRPEGRTGPQARLLHERFGPESDNRGLASATLHFKETCPEGFARLAHTFCVHDFMLFRLCGAVATDPSSGPRSLDAAWPADVWEFVGATPPPVRRHDEILGTLLPETAARLGLPVGIAVVNGGHDGACANIGAGAISVGQVCVTMGTNVVARSISSFPAQQRPWRGISAYHFLPGRWCCGGDAGFAGASATWLAENVRGTHEELEAAARKVPPGAGGLTFLPFFRGQIAPEARREARAAYLGITESTGRAELYRATIEGVAYLYRSIRERLAEMDLGHGEWRVSGGGAHNALWMEVMAALLERPLLIGEPEEGPRGAAMLAAVGLGWYPDVESCAAEWVRTVRVVEPDPALTAAYLPHYERYRRLADAVYSVEAGKDSF